LLVTASFHVGEEGPDWHQTLDAPPPGPDELLTDASTLGSIDPIEIRPVAGPRDRLPAAVLPRLHPYWARPRRTLPDDPILHACALAFVSDYMMVSSAQVLDDPAPADSVVVTLDHAGGSTVPASTTTGCCTPPNPRRSRPGAGSASVASARATAGCLRPSPRRP
jgi:acyl-CoA thioesterase-2